MEKIFKSEKRFLCFLFSSSDKLKKSTLIFCRSNSICRETEVKPSKSETDDSGTGRHLPMPQALSQITKRSESIGRKSPSPSPPLQTRPSSPSATPIRMSSAAETLGAVGGGSGGSGASGAATPAGENEDAAWRNFCYEHPLHAATSAMLNLGGASALSEDTAVNSVGSILVSTYEHHYYPGKNQNHHQSHQHHSSVNNLPPISTSVPVHKDGKSMNEIWS